MSKLLKRSLFYFLLLSIWVALVEMKVWPEYLFPSPLNVLEEIGSGFFNGEYSASILASMRRLFIGYLISIVIGVPLGCLLAVSKTVNDTLGSLILGLQTLPSICWLPMAILWFGLNDMAIIFVVVTGSALSISLATTAGIRQIPSIYLKVAKTMGAKGHMLYRHVILTAAFPTIVGGLKQGWSFAWRALMSAELLFVGTGLGHLLDMGRELNNMDRVMAVILLIIAIGFFADMIFARIEKRIAKRWGYEQA